MTSSGEEGVGSGDEIGEWEHQAEGNLGEEK